MFEQIKKYPTYTIMWVILVSLTSFTFLIGWNEMVSNSVVGVLLLVTFVKGQLVSDYFMELKHTKKAWRMGPIIWLLAILILIGMTYYL